MMTLMKFSIAQSALEGSNDKVDKPKNGAAWDPIKLKKAGGKIRRFKRAACRCINKRITTKTFNHFGTNDPIKS